MNDIRNGNMSVNRLKREINEHMTTLIGFNLSKESLARLLELKKFLEMIEEPQYVNCKTVSGLRQKIIQELKKVEVKLQEFNQYVPAYQLSFFDTYEEVEKTKDISVEKQKENLEKEINHLYKCLCICDKKSYFK